MRRRHQNRQRGLTIIELLIVVSIGAILLVVFLFNSTRQLSRAQDSRRKADLERVKVAFEEFYNDNGCYPTPGTLDNCGSSALAPYLDKIPCDPMSKAPYPYLPVEGNTCAGYRVLASLDNADDPSITSVGCDTSCGCGWGSTYNYGISAGVPLQNTSCEPLIPEESNPTPGASPLPSSTPGPSTEIFVHACIWTPPYHQVIDPSCQSHLTTDPKIRLCVTFQTRDECIPQCVRSNPNIGSILCDYLE